MALGAVEMGIMNPIDAPSVAASAGSMGRTPAATETAMTIGTITSLLMPGESMWQLAAWHMQPPIMRDLHMTPFSTGSVPTPAMVVWAAGYVVVTLLIALRQFSRREL